MLLLGRLLDSRDRLRWTPGLKVGSSLMLAAGIVLSLVAARAFEAREPLTRPLILQGIAVLLFAAAFPLIWRHLESDVETGDKELAESDISFLGYSISSRALEGRLVGLIIALAVLARFLNLGSLPYGLWFDEAQNGVEARHILEDPSYRPVFIPGLSQLPALFFYVIAVFIRIFGADSFGVRAMSATAGVLSVVGFYLLARLLFGSRVALVAGFLLATSRWHVNFSRFGMHGILAVLFEVFALYFVFRGLKSEKRKDFFWAGLAMGLSLHGYYSSVLVPGFALLLVAHKAIFEGWRPTSRRLQCVAVMLATVVLVYSPTLMYAKDHPQEFLQRQSTVFIFTGKTQQQAIAAVLESTKKHLLMFNYQGDNNGRHNLPGAPMLDFITSALAILGLGYSIFRLNRSAYFLIVIWFFGMLLPGILSLDFEAPQAYRDIGVIPAVYLLVAVALFQIGRLGRWVLGRPFRLGTAAAMAMMAIVVGYINLNLYFTKQVPDNAVWSSFSGVETRVARLMVEEGAGKDVYVSPVYHNYPTLRFLAPKVDAKLFQPQDVLPFREQRPRDTVLLLEPSYAYVLPILKSFYPAAKIREERGPQQQPVLLYASVSAADMSEIVGLDARYYNGSEFTGEPALQRRDQTASFDWRQPPVPTPFSAEWSGNILVPAYDTYRLGVETTEWAALFIDGEPLLENQAGYLEKNLTLAKGLHAIQLRATVSKEGSLKVLWSSSKMPRQSIPPNLLYVSRAPNNGLVGYYFPNADFSGSPAYAQIDRTVSFIFHIFPLPRPYSIEWRGKLDVPTTGVYKFGSEAIDYSWIFIDEQPLVENKVLNRYLEAPIPLTAGPHDIRVRFMNRSDFSHINVFWTPPGGQRELLPWERLSVGMPSREPQRPPSTAPVVSTTPGTTPLLQSTPTPVETPSPAPTVLPDGTPSAPPSPFAPFGLPRPIAEWGTGGTGNGQFSSPRDIVFDGSDTLYVLDYGNQRIQKFSPTGEFLTVWGGRGSRDGQFRDLFDLAFGPDGLVYALDSGTGYIQKFDGNGFLRGVVDLTGQQVFNPRGMALDVQSNIYVADTGRNRVLKLDPSGTLMTSWGTGGSGDGLFLEPSDVAVDLSGNVYVADTNNNRIQKFDAEGRFLKAWLSPADQGGMSGSRLSLDTEGNLYVTGGSNQLYAFTTNGDLKMAFGATGGEEVRMNMPRGIAVDRQGLLYVAESGANRIRKLAVRGP